jgi:hypothetical protein
MPVPQSRFPPLRKGDRIANEAARAGTQGSSPCLANPIPTPPRQDPFSSYPQIPTTTEEELAQCHGQQQNFFQHGDYLQPERTSSPIPADELGSMVDRGGQYGLNGNNRRRPVRTEERRYLTAGAVEDLKVCTPVDSAIIP